MTRSNPIQFAVVREDPRTLRAVGDTLDAQPERVLLVASGGCTALAAQTWWPDAQFVLVDPNPAQIALVREKLDVLAGGVDAVSKQRFNVDTDDREGLSQRGNFESLFRSLRHFVEEFVVRRSEIERWFDDAAPTDPRPAFEHPYWPVAFDLFFHDSLLETMFGPAATQHAPRGSYPGYFRNRIESGLLRDDRVDNPFLHHVFLGRYLDRDAALPEFLRAPAPEHHFAFVDGTFDAIQDFDAFDVLDLSNVMDWMDEDAARQMAERIGHQMRAGARVLWRQLNNTVDREPWFGAVVFNPALSQELVAADRSLFYASIHVGTKT